jgi:hypothetical protein
MEIEAKYYDPSMEKEMEIEAKYYDPSMGSLIHYIPPISKKCYLVSDRRRLCFGLF